MKNKILNDYHNIAIIQTAFIGDILLTLPLAAKIKEIHPDSRLIFVTTPVAKDIVSCSKDIDITIVFDKRNNHKGLEGIRSIAQQLKDNDVDLILSAHRSLRSALTTHFAKPLLSIGFNNASMNFLYKKRIFYDRTQHEIDRNLSLLSKFSDYNGLHPNRIELQTQDNINILEKNNISGDFILLAPGSVWGTKRWPADYYLELSKALKNKGYSVVVIGSNSEMELGRYVADKSDAINLAGMTTLLQLFEIMKISKLLITNDSAPTHLAYLADLPTITIFGATIPEFGFAPIGNQSKSIEIKGLKCRPCSIHGPQKCPLAHHKCMKIIMPEYVLDEAMQIIDNK